MEQLADDAHAKKNGHRALLRGVSYLHSEYHGGRAHGSSRLCSSGKILGLTRSVQVI